MEKHAKNLKQKLKVLASRFGAVLFEIAPTSSLLDAPEGHTVTDILASARSNVVLVIKMLDTQVDIYQMWAKREQILDNHHIKPCIPLMDDFFPENN